MEDNSFLEQLYDKNKDYFQALNIYIAAGELKLEEINTKMLPELRKKAEQTGDQMDYQEVNDLTQFADRLDKRVYDLRLSRQITIQQAPQIRLIQNTNQALAEKNSVFYYDCDSTLEKPSGHCAYLAPSTTSCGSTTPSF